jgi:hypothetical protein
MREKIQIYQDFIAQLSLLLKGGSPLISRLFLPIANNA